MAGIKNYLKSVTLLKMDALVALEGDLANKGFDMGQLALFQLLSTAEQVTA